MKKHFKSIGIYLILFAAAFFIYQFMVTAPAKIETKIYSDFMQELDNDKLSAITIENDKVTAVRKDNSKFIVEVPSSAYVLNISAEDIKLKALEKGLSVDFKTEDVSVWDYIIPYLFPLLIIALSRQID